MSSPHHKLSKKSGFVYLAACHENGIRNHWYKIGISKYDPFGRVKKLSDLKAHGEVEFIHFYASLNATASEKLLHSLAECISESRDREYFLMADAFHFFELQFFNAGEIEKAFIRKCLRGDEV